MTDHCLRTLLVLTAAAATLYAQSPGVEQQAKAILEARCLSCHGDKVRMSDLDLRDAPSVRKGGKRGPAVVPGDAAASLLYKAVARKGGELQMPPGKSALPPAEQKVLHDWINAGARLPADPAGDRSSSAWWSFRKPQRPPVPAPTNGTVRTPIDAFILAALEKQSLQPAPPADRRTFARRAYFDLHGLPPTPQEVDQFVNDSSDKAYENLIERLLASPRYGERWGRYWLDLVRYADTSGFETDHFFVSAWRYRDYVIESFNNDKPYHTFVQEQIAADELWSTSTDLEGTLRLPASKAENLKRRIGTALFTLGSFPIEYTYYGDQFRAEWQAEAVDTVGAAFLGLTMGCARCHDHKFDPLTQRDYYRMSALFAGSTEREIHLGSLFDVQSSTRSFPLLAHAEAVKRMARSQRKRSPEMLQQLGEAYLKAPPRPNTAHVLGHEEEMVPDTYLLVKGDFKNRGEVVEPGFPAALPGTPIEEPKGFQFIPQRRKALALWLTSPDHPLLARVMVNRIWQGHFGQGLVRTPNDFGRQGDAPTHPELLDWLATEFVRSGWSIKQMHRLILLSNTYRASSVASQDALTKDPDNRYLSHMSRRRLDGDALRDTVLAVAGSLNLKMGGVGIIPPLTKEEILAARMPDLWPTHPDPTEHNRRSIYLQMKRSLTLPLLQIFDAPDSASNCARRESSTVAPQALAMMNSEFTATQAQRFTERVRKEAGATPQTPTALVDTAWRIAFARTPVDSERRTALAYLERNSLDRLCLLIFNMSEFLYAD